MKSMLRSAVTLSSLLLSLVMTSAAHGQSADPGGCNAGLAPVVVQSQKDVQLQLSYLHMLNEKQYDAMKRSGSLEGEFKLISASASYDDFQEKLRERAESVKMDLNIASSESFVYSTVNTDAWRECKRNYILKQNGFFCDTTQVSKDQVVVTCNFRPLPVGAAERVAVSIDGQPKPQMDIDLGPNQSRDFVIQRNPEKDLFVNFRPKVHSDVTIELARIPPPIIVDPRPKVIALGSCIGRGGVADVHFWGPVGEACNGNPAWGKYLTDSSPQSSGRLCSCTGKGKSTIRLWGPEGTPCGGIAVWGVHDQQCTSREKLSICSCRGKGDIFNEMNLWGPRGETCAGATDMSWGRYDQHCVTP